MSTGRAPKIIIAIATASTSVVVLLLIIIVIVMVVGFVQLNKRKNLRSTAYPNPVYYNHQGRSIFIIQYQFSDTTILFIARH